jgi:hypothetical protein
LIIAAGGDIGSDIAMIFKWLPWKRLMRWTARRHGFLDPVGVFSALERFAQPSEVSSPIELLRAGLVFHARGLLNTKAIQHNLDWVWPYWVQRQFDPGDASFLPRAFSISHVNLTHRNWTAVGLPGCNALPIVDPRGLVTPFYDGWSLAAWIITDDGGELLPPRAADATQRLLLEEENIAVETVCAGDGLRLLTDARVVAEREAPILRLRCRAEASREGWLVISLRPFNPEGVSFVHEIRLDQKRTGWIVNGVPCVEFDRPVERHVTSDYRNGDVHLRMREREEVERCWCRVGLATAAALYRLKPGEPAEVRASVDLLKDKDSAPVLPLGRVERWSEAIEGAAVLRVPDERTRFLFDAALRTLVLHSPEDVYPGPFTYKRFWFRDAALILNAMLCAGILSRARRVLDRFHKRQRVDGFFLSQSGEWDSNGEALWIMRRYAEFSGRTPPRAWHGPVLRAARWIVRKRCASGAGELHAGLMPAGFSAEHLGNNDYYYWDDFWSVAGLRSAAAMCRMWKEERPAAQFEEEADDLMRAVESSLERSREIRDHAGIPASPYRRMDAGAIGSLAVGYPLHLWAPRDPRLMGTVDYLLSDCMVKGAFFQDMIHSGMNPYLTLHLAQALLRAGDRRFHDLARVVAELASPTGQWPEAVHPHTGGGCMGDGQHVWAAAEWVMMVRNMFVREEADGLALLSGVPADWLKEGSRVAFGPGPTRFGRLSVAAEGRADGVSVQWRASWWNGAPAMEFAPEGLERRSAPGSEEGELFLRRREGAERP